MITLTDASKQLGISRQALSKWLTRLDIVTQRQGHGVCLSDADVEKVREARETGTAATQPQRNATQLQPQLIAVLQSQMDLLKEQLQKAESREQELLRQNANYQQMVMVFQRRNMELETKLLEAPPVEVNHEGDSVPGFVGRVLERVKKKKKKKK